MPVILSYDGQPTRSIYSAYAWHCSVSCMNEALGRANPAALRPSYRLLRCRPPFSYCGRMARAMAFTQSGLLVSLRVCLSSLVPFISFNSRLATSSDLTFYCLSAGLGYEARCKTRFRARVPATCLGIIAHDHLALVAMDLMLGNYMYIDPRRTGC